MYKITIDDFGILQEIWDLFLLWNGQPETKAPIERFPLLCKLTGDLIESERVRMMSILNRERTNER